MPSYKNYKNDFLKSANSINLFNQPKLMVNSKKISKERREKLIDWITFYRRNIHLFVKHYFGVTLYPYQIFWIYLMGVSDSFVSICARAAAKSWMVALFATARAVLYPGSNVVVVSSTKEQAGVIISEKVTSLRDSHPNIAREIESITTNMNKYEVVFHNGSYIRVVPARESARGKRATFTIYEEFRLIDKEVLDAIIRPFAFIRQPPYLKKPEYAHLAEEPREAFISSAYHKGLWWYKETITQIKMLLNGENVGFFATDYLTAIRHNIKTAAQIKRERKKMDSITFMEEYENIPWGEASDAYFKLNMFTRARKIYQPFYPTRDEDVGKKVVPFPRSDGEIRIVSCDVAMRAGRTNDLAVIMCIRLIPTLKGYIREVVYIETYSGRNTLLQAQRIKQIFYEFEADWIVLDVAQAGISVYDALGQLTKDEERGNEYLPMTVMRHDSIDKETYDELLKRTLGLNAIPVIYPISGTAKLNSSIAVALRDKLQKRMIRILVDENAAEDFRVKKDKNYMTHTSDRAWILHPHIQTSLLIGECVNLSMSVVGGYIKLSEPSGGRKDRYTCLSYGNYFASFLDNSLMKVDEKDTNEEMMLSLTQFV